MENGFVIGFFLRPVILTEAYEVLLIAAFLDKIAKETGGIFVVKKTVVLVPLVNNTPPCCPSANAESCSEEIVAGHSGCLFIIVGSRYHADTSVTFIAVKHFLAEGKERL